MYSIDDVRKGIKNKMTDVYFGFKLFEEVFPLVIMLFMISFYVILVKLCQKGDKTYNKRKDELTDLGFKVTRQDYKDVMVAPDTRWNLTEKELYSMKNREYRRFVRNYKKFVAKAIREG